MSTTTETYMCTSCGEAVEDPELAEHQLANVKGGQTPMCGSCIDTHVRNGLTAAFETIREALSASKRRQWDEFSLEEKFIRFLYYRNEDIIRPKGESEYQRTYGSTVGGPLSLEEVTRLKAAKMRYEGTLGDIESASR